MGQGLQPLSSLTENHDLRPCAGLSLRPEGQMGRQRPYWPTCRLRAHRLSSLEAVVPQVVYRHGGAMARTQPPLRQQCGSAAHLPPRLQQIYILPQPVASAVQADFHRQSRRGGKESHTDSHGTVASHQPRRVQFHCATHTAGIPQEHHAAAIGEGETALCPINRDTAEARLVYRHHQHDRHTCRPVGKPAFHRCGTHRTNRCHDTHQLRPTLCPSDGCYIQGRALLV